MIWKELLQDMDRAQREMFRWMEAPLQQGSFPPISIYKNEDGLLLHAEVPGVDPDEVELSIANDVVTISGKVKEYGAPVEESQKGEDSGEETQTKSAFRTLRREHFHGDFSRTIELPVEVDSAKAQAQIKEGLLTLTLPLREETKPRKISVTQG